MTFEKFHFNYLESIVHTFLLTTCGGGKFKPQFSWSLLQCFCQLSYVRVDINSSYKDNKHEIFMSLSIEFREMVDGKELRILDSLEDER